MRSVSRSLQLLMAVLALCLAGQGASARSAHGQRGRVVPAARAYGGRFRVVPVPHAYDASGAKAEEFFGTSVPYDPDGPGYNDFQLQGTD